MILLALVLAAQGQWTGPHTERFDGPGYFCGGGYVIRLMRGDRALVLPQSAGAGAPGVRLVLGGREVNVWSGASPERGRTVLHYGGTLVAEQGNGGRIGYIVSDQGDIALQLTSSVFRGFSQDGWFFSRANFSSTAENRVRCLAGASY